MFTSVFSFLVSAGGFTIVVLLSFFCSGGFTTVVLLSFFSAGGFVTVVSFCSQAANSAIPKSRQIYFFIPMNRITATRVMPLSLPPCGEFKFYRSRWFLAARYSDALCVSEAALFLDRIYGFNRFRESSLSNQFTEPVRKLCSFRKF